MERIKAIREIIPGCAISTDVISGFCAETEEEHQDTLSLMEEVQYDMAFMFKYSERPRTLAERKFTDDVPEDVKGRRLTEVIDLQMSHSLIRTKRMLGKVHKVLVEGRSKRSENDLYGRNSENVVMVFPKGDLKPGMYAMINAKECTSTTLIGEVVEVLA